MLCASYLGTREYLRGPVSVVMRAAGSETEEGEKN